MVPLVCAKSLRRMMQVGTPSNIFIQAFFWSPDTKTILGGSSMISAFVPNLSKSWEALQNVDLQDFHKIPARSLCDICLRSWHELFLNDMPMQDHAWSLQYLRKTLILDDLHEILRQNPLKVSVNVVENLCVKDPAKSRISQIFWRTLRDLCGSAMGFALLREKISWEYLLRRSTGRALVDLFARS